MDVPEALCTLSFCGHFLSVTAEEEQTTEAQRSQNGCHARGFVHFELLWSLPECHRRGRATTEAQRSQKGCVIPEALCTLSFCGHFLSVTAEEDKPQKHRDHKGGHARGFVHFELLWSLPECHRRGRANHRSTEITKGMVVPGFVHFELLWSLPECHRRGRADHRSTEITKGMVMPEALCTLSFCGHFLSVTAEEEQTTEAQRSQKGWSFPRLCAL